MRRKILGLLLVLIIVISSVIIYHTYIIRPPLPVRLEPKATFKSNSTLEFINVRVIHINGSEYFLIDEYSKILIKDHEENTLIEGPKNADLVYQLVDINNDGTDEIVTISDARIITILDYKLKTLSTFNLYFESLYGILFIDLDGDNQKELLVVEGYMGDITATLKVFKFNGSLLLEYTVEDTRISSQEYYAFYSVTYKTGYLNNDIFEDAVIFITFARKIEQTYISDFHTHIITVCQNNVLWEKKYDIGPLITYYDSFIIESADFDKDNATEFAIVCYYQGYVGIAILYEDGDLDIIKFYDIWEDISSIGYGSYDFNGDSYLDAIFAIGFEEMSWILALNVMASNLTRFRISNVGSPIGVIHSNSKKFVIFFDNNTEIILTNWNGTIKKEIKLNTSELFLLAIMDVNNNGLDEIVVAGKTSLGEKLYVIDTNGVIIRSFDIIRNFFAWGVIRDVNEFYLALMYWDFVYIYSSNGTIVDQITAEDLEVPKIERKVLLDDLDGDYSKELVVIISNMIFVYDFSNKSVEKVYTPAIDPIVVQVVAADIDGDSVKEIVIFDYAGDRIIGVSLKKGVILLAHYDSSNKFPFKLITYDMDGDEKEEIIVLNDVFKSYEAVLIEVYDDNGSLISDFEIYGINISSTLIFKASSYNNSPCILIFAQKSPKEYLFLVYSSNGTKLYRCKITTYHNSKPIAALATDLDNDGLEEIVFTSFEGYHYIRLIRIYQGIEWSIPLDHPNISRINETKASYDRIELLTWQGETIIGLEYIYTYGSKAYIRFMLIDSSGEIIMKRLLVYEMKGAWKYRIPYDLQFMMLENKLYGVISIIMITSSGRYEYGLAVYDLATKRLGTLTITKEQVKDLIISDIDNNGLIDILKIKDYEIYVWELEISE